MGRKDTTLIRRGAKFVVISLLAISAFPVIAATPTGDAAKQSARCGPGAKQLDQLICADADLSADDLWSSSLYRARLSETVKAERQQLVREQRKFAVEREHCMPTVVQAAPAPQTPEQAAPRPGADGKSPPVAQKAPDPIQDTPAATETSDDGGPAIDLDQVTACLHKVYDSRIATLEAPLKYFVDISQDAPTAPDICTAVSSLQSGGRSRIIALHALPTEKLDLVDELHPETKIQHLRQYIGEQAWAAAKYADATFTNGLPTVAVSKVPLYPNRPQIWVFSTVVGKDRISSTYLFDSETDGGKADHYTSQFDSDAGSVKPLFVRFHGQPYAITGTLTQQGTEVPPIYDLTKSEAACSPR